MGRLVAGYDLLFIDEAQRVPDIGINLKILTDGLPDLRIVATGSSSFELANRVSEPLTGRTSTCWNRRSSSRGSEGSAGTCARRSPR